MDQQHEANEQTTGSSENGTGRESSGRSRVLHARISEELYEALSKVAAELRVPVSNLVRNALEDTFTLVDHVSVNVQHLVGRAMREAGEVGAQVGARFRHRRATSEEEGRPQNTPRADASTFAHVQAWQPVVLNAAQQCTSCGTALQAGQRVHLGIEAPAASSSAPVWLCRPCFWNLR